MGLISRVVWPPVVAVRRRGDSSALEVIWAITGDADRSPLMIALDPEVYMLGRPATYDRRWGYEEDDQVYNRRGEVRVFFSLSLLVSLKIVHHRDVVQSECTHLCMWSRLEQRR